MVTGSLYFVTGSLYFVQGSPNLFKGSLKMVQGSPHEVQGCAEGMDFGVAGLAVARQYPQRTHGRVPAGPSKNCIEPMSKDFIPPSHPKLYTWLTAYNGALASRGPALGVSSGVIT